MRFESAEKLKQKNEEGIWRRIETPYFKNLRLLVTPGPSMATISRIQELNTAYRKRNGLKEGKDIPVEDSIRLAMRAHAGRKIKGWDGLIDDETGAVPTFSEENFVAVCMQFDLWAEVTKAINDDEAFESEAVDDLRGNS